MNELPESWLTCKLGDVINYGTTQKAEPADIPDDAWVLELEDIEKDTSKILQRMTFRQRQSKSTKSRFSAGDILYGKLRPYLNKVVRTDQDGYCTTEIIPIKPSEIVEGAYLFHWLKAPTFIDYVTSVSHGLNMPRLGTEAGRQAPFVLAPINEQKRIADKLDAVLAQVDACRDRLDRIPAILKRFRQSVIAAATSGKLTEDWRTFHHADSWQQTQLRELALLITKGASPNWQGISYIDAGAGATLFVTSQNVRDMRMDVSEPKYVDSAFNQGQRRSVLRRGDLLTNIVGASIGRSAIYDSDELANINQAVCLIRLKEDVERKFILYILSAPATLEYMNLEKVDVARANLSLVDIGNIPVELPTRAEQTEIVRRVEALFAYADRLEARYTAARAQIEKLTPATLAKAFRGELVPQDPNDEPASALLERIHTARIAEVGVGGLKRRKVSEKAVRKLNVEVIMLELTKIKSDHLNSILKEQGKLAPKALWQASQLSIENFYEQLRTEEAKRLLREVREGNDRFLEAA